MSPAYATRLRASGIIYRLYANVPFENVFLLAPYKLGEESRIQDLGFRIQDDAARNDPES
jgi:hypothetical protein